jgi:hypothetical protein
MSEGGTRGPGEGGGQQALAIAVAGLLGQIGCVTLILIALALAGGLWLDSQLTTKPLFTILFVLGTVPITLYLMVRMVLGGMSRLGIAAQGAEDDDGPDEEADVGRPTT